MYTYIDVKVYEARGVAVSTGCQRCFCRHGGRSHSPSLV